MPQIASSSLGRYSRRVTATLSVLTLCCLAARPQIPHLPVTKPTRPAESRIPFLLPSKKCLNVVQAIHHLLELRFHATSRSPRKYYRPVSLWCCALPSTGFLSHSSEKTVIRKTGNLSLRQIYTTRAP